MDLKTEQKDRISECLKQIIITYYQSKWNEPSIYSKASSASLLLFWGWMLIMVVWNPSPMSSSVIHNSEFSSLLTVTHMSFKFAMRQWRMRLAWLNYIYRCFMLETLWTHVRIDRNQLMCCSLRYINAAISFLNSDHQYSITGFLSMFNVSFKKAATIKIT